MDAQILNENYLNDVALQKENAKNTPEKSFEKPRSKSKFAFENFAVGKCNEYAFNACKAAATRPSCYNPIFICGGTGLGKTHLLKATENHARKEYGSECKIECLTSESFMDEYADAHRNHAVKEFREKYKNLDILLLDDIEFIWGKVALQGEIFRLLKAMKENGGQIIVASRLQPYEMKKVDRGLDSFFLSGIVAELKAPDYETRVEIMRKKLSCRNDSLSENVIDYIAEAAEIMEVAKNTKTNVRELEGILMKVLSYKDLLNVEITLEKAKEIVEQMTGPVLKRVGYSA